MENWNLFESGALVWIEQNLRHPIIDPIMFFFSWINNAGLWAILMVLMLLVYKKYRDVGVTAMVSLAMEFFLINVVVKPWVQRIRPYDVNEAIHILVETPTDYSFPSGHTGAAFAVAFVVLLCMSWKWGVSVIAVASMIAFSRLYNGVHYPTDVLGALVIAFVTALLASKLVYPRIHGWLERKKPEKNEIGV